MDGIQEGAELTVVKKGRVRLGTGPGRAGGQRRRLVGSLRVERLDERVAVGTLSKRSFFDLINPGDEVIFAGALAAGAAAAKPPEAPQTTPQSLLRRLYRLLGF